MAEQAELGTWLLALVSEFWSPPFEPYNLLDMMIASLNS